MRDKRIWELGPGTAHYKNYKLEIVNICLIGYDNKEPLVWAWAMDNKTIAKLEMLAGRKRRSDFTLIPMDEAIDSTLTFFNVDITEGPHNGETMAEYFLRPHPNRTGHIWRINPRRDIPRRAKKSGGKNEQRNCFSL